MSDTRKMFDVIMPFVLKAYCGGYIVLNRGYKPLGFPANHHAKYDRCPILVEIPSMTRRLASRLSHNESYNIGTIALYGSESHPQSSADNMYKYMKRLELLGRLQVTPMEWPRNAEFAIAEADDNAFANRQKRRAEYSAASES